MEEAVGCGGSDVKAFNFIVMHGYRKLHRDNIHFRWTFRISKIWQVEKMGGCFLGQGSYKEICKPAMGPRKSNSGEVAYRKGEMRGAMKWKITGKAPKTHRKNISNLPLDAQGGHRAGPVEEYGILSQAHHSLLSTVAILILTDTKQVISKLWSFS